MLSEKCPNWVKKGYTKEAINKSILLKASNKVKKILDRILRQDLCECGHTRASHRYNGKCKWSGCYCTSFYKKTWVDIYHCRLELCPSKFLVENASIKHHKCPNDCKFKNQYPTTMDFTKSSPITFANSFKKDIKELFGVENGAY